MLAVKPKPKKQGRICPNCNRPIPADADICPYCAKDFKDK